MFQLKRIYGGNKTAITSIDITPDGTKIATSDVSGWIVVRDVASKTILKKFQPHSQRINKIKFSADGKYLVSCSDDFNVHVHNVGGDWTKKTTFGGHFQKVPYIDVSSDSTRVASFGDDGRLRYWNIETGSEAWNYVAVGTTMVKFSPDGSKIALGTSTNDIQVIFSSTKTVYRTLTGKHTGAVNVASWSPDGTLMYSAGVDMNIVTWNILLGTFIALETYAGHTDVIKSMDISSDGKKLLTGSVNGEAKMWSLEEKKFVRDMNNHGVSSINGVKFMPDGNKAFTCADDKYIVQVDSASGSEIAVFSGHTSKVNRVAVNSSGTICASASLDKSVKLWDTSTGSTIRTLTGHTLPVWGVAFNAAGDKLASCSEDKTVIIWNVNTGDKILKLLGHSAKVVACKFSPDGAFVYSASLDKTIKKWDLATGNIVATFSGHTGEVWALDVSFDGSLICSGSTDYTVKVWNATTAAIVSTISGAHTAGIYDVAFNKDASCVASASEDALLKIWKRIDGSLLKSFTFGSYVWGCAFTADNESLVAVSADMSIRFFDVSNASPALWSQKTTIPAAHSSGIRSCAIVGNGLYTGAEDNTVKFWDVSAEVATQLISGHSDFVDKVFLVENETIIISASRDTTIKVWNVATKEMLQNIKVDGIVYDAEYCELNKQLAVTTMPGTLYIYTNDAGVLTEKSKITSNFIRGLHLDFNIDGTKLACVGMTDAVAGTPGHGHSIRIFNTADMSVIKNVVSLYNATPDGFLWNNAQTTDVVWDSTSNFIYIASVGKYDFDTSHWSVPTVLKYDIINNSSVFVYNAGAVYNQEFGGQYSSYEDESYGRYRLKTNAEKTVIHMYAENCPGRNYSRLYKSEDFSLIKDISSNLINETIFSYLKSGKIYVVCKDNFFLIFDYFGTLLNKNKPLITSPAQAICVGSLAKKAVIGYDSKIISVINLEGYYNKEFFPATSEILESVKFSDFSKVIFSTKDNLLKKIDTATGLTDCFINNSNGYFMSLAITPDNSKVVCGCSDSCVYIYNTSDLSLVKKISGDFNYTQVYVDVNFLGTKFVASSYNNNKDSLGTGAKVVIYDINSFAKINSGVVSVTPNYSSFYVNSVVFLKDEGKALLSVNNEYGSRLHPNVIVVDLNNFVVKAFAMLENSERIFWSNSSEYYGYYAYYKIAKNKTRDMFGYYIYTDIGPLQSIGLLGCYLANEDGAAFSKIDGFSYYAASNSIGFSGDGKKIIVSHADKTITIRDVKSTKSITKKMFISSMDRFSSIQTNEDLTKFFISGYRNEKMFSIINVPNNSIGVIDNKGSNDGTIYGCVFTKDGSEYITTDNLGKITFWDSTTHLVKREYNENLGVYSPKISSDGLYLYYLAKDYDTNLIYKIVKMKLSDLSVVWEIKSSDVNVCNDWDISPDETFAITIHTNKIKKYNLTTQTEDIFLNLSSNDLYRILICKNNTDIIVFGSNLRIIKYRAADLVETKNVLMTVGMTGIAHYDPDDNYFISGWTQGTPIMVIKISDLSVWKTNSEVHDPGNYNTISGYAGFQNGSHPFDIKFTKDKEFFYTSGSSIHKYATGSLALLDSYGDYPAINCQNISPNLYLLNIHKDSEKVVATDCSRRILQGKNRTLGFTSKKYPVSSCFRVSVSPDKSTSIFATYTSATVITYTFVKNSDLSIVKTLTTTPPLQSISHYTFRAPASGPYGNQRMMQDASKIKWKKDGSAVFISSKDKVEMYETAGFTLVRTFSMPTNTYFSSFELSENCKYIFIGGYYGSNTNNKIFLVSDGTQVLSNTENIKMFGVSESLELAWYITNVNNADVIIKGYDLMTNTKVFERTLTEIVIPGRTDGTANTSFVGRMASSSDNKTVAMNFESMPSYDAEIFKHIYVLSFTSNSVSVIKDINLNASMIVDEMNFFNSDKNLYAFSVDDNNIRIYDAETNYTEVYKKPLFISSVNTGSVLKSVVSTFFDSGNMTQFFAEGNVVYVPDFLNKTEGFSTFLNETAYVGTHFSYIEQRCIDSNPSETLVASGGQDGLVVIWDKATLSPLKRLNSHNLSPVMGVAFSKDGTKFASCSMTGRVVIYNVSDWSILKTVDAVHVGGTLRVLWSTDSLNLFTAGSDAVVKLWKVSDWSLVQTYSGHTGNIVCLNYNGDGTKIITSSADSTAKVWEVSTGYKLKDFIGHSGPAYSAVFNQDETKVYTTDNGGNVRIFNYSNAVQISSKIPYGAIALIDGRFSKDFENYIFTGNFAGISITDINLNEINRLDYMPFNCGSLYACNNGKDFITATHHGGSGRIMLISNFTKKTTKSILPSEHSGKINGLFFDKTMFSTASLDNTVKVWNISTGISRTIQQSNGEPLWSVLDETNDEVIFSTATGYVSIYKLSDLSLKKSVNIGTFKATFLDVTIDKIVVSTNTGVIKILSRSDLSVIKTITKAHKKVWFSEDGLYIYIANAGKVTFYKFSDDTSSDTIIHATASLLNLKLNKSRTKMLCSLDNGSLVVLDISSKTQDINIVAHTGTCLSASMSPDSKYIVTCGSDGLQNVIDVSKKTIIKKSQYHSGNASLTEWYEDSSKFITVGETDIKISINEPISCSGLGEYAYIDASNIKHILSPKNKAYFFCSTDTGYIYKIDKASGKPLAYCLCSSESILKISTNSDETEIVYTTATKVGFLNTATFVLNYEKTFTCVKAFASKVATNYYVLLADGNVKELKRTDDSVIRTLSIASASQMLCGEVDYVNDRIVAGLTTGNIKIVKITDWTLEKTISAHASNINYLCLKNSVLITAGKDKIVKVYNATTLQLKNTFVGHSDEVYWADINDSASKVYSCGKDQTVRVWDVQKEFLAKTLYTHTGYVVNQVCAKDEDFVISFSADKSSVINDAKSLMLKNISSGHVFMVKSGKISPDKTRIVSGDSGGNIKIWNLTSKSSLKNISGHSSSVNWIDITSDGSKIISGGSDKKLNIWNAADYTNIASVTAHTNVVYTAKVNGDKIVTCSNDAADKLIKVWDLLGNNLHTFTSSLTVCDAEFNPAGDIVAELNDTRIQLWNYVTKNPITNWTTTGALQLCWSKNGQYIITIHSDGYVRMWNASNGTLYQSSRPTTTALISVFYTNSDQIIVGGDDKNIYTLNSSLVVIKTISRHDAKVTRVTSDSASVIIASVSEDMSVKAFDLSSGNIVWVSKYPHSTAIHSIVTNHAENTVYTAADDFKAISWESSTGSYLQDTGIFSGSNGTIFNLELNKDETKLLVVKAVTDRDMAIYDTATMDKIMSFTLNRNNTLIQANYIKDYQYICLLDSDGYIVLYQPETQVYLREFATQGTGSQGFVWSPDFSKVYVYNQTSKKIKSYDYATGTELKIYTTNMTVTIDRPSCLCISKDGTKLFVIDKSGKINIFNESTAVLEKTYQVVGSPSQCTMITVNDAMSRIFVSCNLGFKIIDYSNGSEMVAIAPGVDVTAFNVNPDTSRLLLGTISGDVMTYDDPDIAPPSIPIVVSSTSITDSALTFIWDTQEVVGGYDVQYKASDSLQWIDLPSVTVTTTSFGSLLQNTNYDFRVRAYKSTTGGVKVSGYTYPVTTKTLISSPNNLQVVVTDKQIDLTWDSNCLADRYIIYSKTASGDYDDGISTSVNAYSVIGSNATAYYFKVSAVVGLIESDKSPELMAITSPLAPTGLKVIQFGNSAILSWKAMASATSYLIEQRKNNEQFEMVAEVSATSANIPNVGGGNTYTYRIKAKNASGTSVNFSSLVILKTTPNAPTGLYAKGSDQRVVLTWDEQFGVQGYSIYMRTGILPFVEIARNVTSAKYIINNLSNGTTYEFKVKAKNDIGESDYSESVQCVPQIFIMPHINSATFTDRYCGSSSDISDVRLARYKFTVTDNSDEFENYISVVLGGTSIDTFLSILDSSGNVLYKNDDSNRYTGESSIIEVFEKGDYTVVCGTYENIDDASEQFSLKIHGRFLEDFIKLEGFGVLDIPHDSPYSLEVKKLTGNNIKISWKPTNDSTEYVVYNKDSAGKLNEIGRVSKNSLTFTVIPAQEYKFYVKSSNSVGDSSLSECYTYPEPTITLPGTPTGLSISQLNSKEVNLQWNSAPNANSYLVLVKENGLFVKVQNIQNPTSSTSVKLSELKTEKSYTFCVKSVNTFGYSDNSDEVNFVPLKSKVEPITGLRILKNETSLKLYWNGNSDFYTILIKKDGERFITLDKTSDLEYTVKDLKVGSKYQFGVVSSNTVGDIGETKYISVDYVPSKPEYVSAEYNAGVLKLTWQHSKNSDHYRIYKKVGSYFYLLNTEEKVTANSFYCNIKDGNLYKYVVRACNEFGESEDSKEATVGI